VTRHEKLIIFIVLVICMMKLGYLGKDILVALLYGAAGPSHYDALVWESWSRIWSALVYLGSAVWVFVEARAAGLRALIWSLLGLTLGLLGILLFYAIQIYQGSSQQKHNQLL
jgi:hypothetical protein